MEAPSPKLEERYENFNKTTTENENYSLSLKIKKKNSIYISITFEKDNKIYEDCKLYDEIKKEQTYFDDYNLEEIFDEISELISKNNVEIIKNEEYIVYSIILPPLKKKKTFDFVLEVPKENLDISMLQKIIKEKNEIIREKDKIIKEKNDTILDLKKIIAKLTGNTDDIDTKEKNENENENKLDYNEIFKDFNIVNLTPKNKLTNHGEKAVSTILQLQDGRLASGGEDENIIIYNKETFKPELTISEHTNGIWDLIQLKNGNLISCSYYDKTMNLYQLIENNKYKLLSQVKVQGNNCPRKIKELENGEIGLVAYESIIFYLNINNNKFDEDFIIKSGFMQIGKYYNMISVKPGELVISGEANKIQFFELNSRSLKEIIVINRDICWNCDNLLCMMNERYLCVGGRDKITIIDINQKNIIREIEDKGVHYCLYKLNDNILLSGNDCGITQWKISQNNLTLLYKKENAHQSSIIKIIRFDKYIISCSYDKSIKIW